VMKQTLLNLFKPYRPVKEIIAHENTRMRGQAFITFPDVEIANKARREVGEFPLYGKPIVSSSPSIERCEERGRRTKGEVVLAYSNYISRVEEVIWRSDERGRPAIFGW
jgi:RNA recognition motif-containing protein